MNKGIVDRFENGYAVIEFDGNKTEDIPRELISPDVSQGDVVEFINGLWQTNDLDTEERRKRIKKLESELWED